jgi:hypothetical protein
MTDEATVRQVILRVRELRDGFEGCEDEEIMQELDSMRVKFGEGDEKSQGVMADLQELRDNVDGLDDTQLDKALWDLERKLGRLLPPIGGQFNISLDTVIKPR